jgi:PAS domain S-box-containing protein/diguanylate cyclase (GGDEF)-like protein
MEALSQEAYKTVLEALPIGVYLVDLDRRILLWSSGAEELTGYLRHEVIGRFCADDLLLHRDENESCVCGSACPLQQTMYDGKPRTAELFLLHKDGHRVPVRVRAVPFHDEHGAIIGAVECFDQRQLFLAADFDPLEMGCQAAADDLTGLPDRRAMETCLRAYIEGYESSRIPFGLAMIAIDSLDRLDETNGPNAVAAVLRVTGRTLAGAMGPCDMVGQWSEGRFLAVVTGCTAPGLLRAANMMKRLVGLERVPWWGDRLSVTLSVGGAIVEDGDTPEALAGRAEMALERSLGQPEDYVLVV